MGKYDFNEFVRLIGVDLVGGSFVHYYYFYLIKYFNINISKNNQKQWKVSIEPRSRYEIAKDQTAPFGTAPPAAISRLVSFLENKFLGKNWCEY